MVVEFWNTAYKGAPSLLERTEDFPDGEEGFKKLYHANNRLRYCNGCYYKPVNSEDQEAYTKFLKTYNTITNFYGGGVVD